MKGAIPWNLIHLAARCFSGEFEPQTGATLTPIYQSSAFEWGVGERSRKIFHNQAPDFPYEDHQLTVKLFEKRMTVLEGGKSLPSVHPNIRAWCSIMHCNTFYSGRRWDRIKRAFMVEAWSFPGSEAFGIKHIMWRITIWCILQGNQCTHKTLFCGDTGNPNKTGCDRYSKALGKSWHTWKWRTALDHRQHGSHCVSDW